MSYDSDSDMERVVGGRRRRGGAVAGAGRGQRDPMVHMMKHELAVERAMGDGRTPAQHHRAHQKASHKHMMGRGFISDLGIPVISNLAGAIGLGHGGAYTGGAMTGGAATGGRRRRGGAMTGGGFISDLGIPVISNLAGAIGLGRRRGGAVAGAGGMDNEYYYHSPPFASGGALLGHDGHGMYQGAGTKKGQVRRTARRAYEGGAMTGGGVAGAGFWDDFKSGFNSVVAPVASIAKPLLSLAGPEGRIASAGLSALGYGKQKRRPAGAHDGRRARAAIVKKVMMERGCSLPEASRIVKQEGLY